MLLLLAAALPARAADDPARTKADVAYQAGLADFQAGRFQEAFDHFHRAYLLDNAPTLLFNMARAAEEMGDAHTAIDHYRLYLDRVPDAEDRPEVERRIRVMEKLAARPAESEPPVRRVAAVSEARPSLMPWAWTALGLGVAGLGVGT